jgi:hypothetical protein
MGEGGRQNKGGTHDPGLERRPPETAPAPAGLDGSRSAPLLDPMRFQRQERASAVAQIDRSLRAWRKAADASSGGGAAIPQGGGAPLAGDTRAKMEKQLGADLSTARVHTGGDSATAARGMGARAFTVGQDVHFGSGEYAPGSKEGDRLLAHELTHVVQGQKSGVQRKPESAGEGAAGDVEVSHPHEPAEQEADAAGDRVADALHDGGGGKAGEHGAAGGHGAGKAGSAPGGGKAGAGGAHGDAKADAGGAPGDAKESAGGAHGDAKADAGGAHGDAKADAGGAPGDAKAGGGAHDDAKAAAGPGDAKAGGADDAGGAKAFRKPLSINASAPRLKIFGKWTEFKDLANNQKGPTTDLTHPHLVELGITNLGPYKYMPLKGEFQYTAPTDLSVAWTHADAAVGFQPEAPPKPQLEAKPAEKAARVAAAKAKFGPGMAEILAHDGGNTPRPFTGVVDEDTRGAAAGAHNVQRHCLSGASDMKTPQDVALRAAFGMIGGVVAGVYTPTASAFASVGAANGTIAPALNGALTTNWMSWRALLAAGKNPAQGGVPGAAGGGSVIFKSVGGTQLPVVEVPKYLGLDPSHKGVSPLWAGDARWQHWWDGNPQERKDYEKAHGVNAKPPALTTDASAGAAGISMRVLPDVSPGNGGWILHAAWPV